MERKLIKNYFERKFPIPAAVIAIIGILSLAGSTGFGLFCILVGGAWAAFAYFLRKPATDEQVDECLAKELEEIGVKGLNKMGLIEEEVYLIKPIIVNGPYYGYINKDAKLMFKKGNDDKVRYSVVKGIVFYFSENQVYSYSCVIDLVTGNRFTETTDEYFYKDIVSIATLSERIKQENPVTVRGMLGLAKKAAKGEEIVHDVEQFRLTTTGGTYISATIKDSTVVAKTKGRMDVEDTEEKIKAMRNLLREKKAV